MARPQKSAISARQKRNVKFLIIDGSKLTAKDKLGETIHACQYHTTEGVMLTKMFDKKAFCKVGSTIVKCK